MKDTLVDQLDGMRETSFQNIGSIKSLISTSEKLEGVICTLSAEHADKESINELIETKKNIGKAIDDLLTHTDQLFDTYKKIADYL